MKAIAASLIDSLKGDRGQLKDNTLNFLLYAIYVFCFSLVEKKTMIKFFHNFKILLNDKGGKH